MFQSKTYSSLAAISLIGALTGCMQHSASQGAAEPEAANTAIVTQLAPPVQTKKPAPPLSFSHEMSDLVGAGETGTVTFTVNEGYPFGTLILEAKGGDGLDVFGASVTTSQDMSNTTTHLWQVNYTAVEDGLYRLHVTATANVDEAVSDARAYAVEVKVGNWQSAASKTTAKATMEMQSDGEPAVILEAEETID